MRIMIHEHLLASTERIVFFDIDSTLSSAVDHCTLAYQPSYNAYKKSIYNDNWKTIRFANFVELSQSSIALFAKFLEQTNAKAICIASWNTDRHEGVFIHELKEAFEALSEFPDDWFLGCAGGGGGDRDVYTIKPFIKKLGFSGDFIAIDDSVFSYTDKSYAIKIDGRLGFNIHDYEKGLALFGINEDPDLE